MTDTQHECADETISAAATESTPVLQQRDPPTPEQGKQKQISEMI